MTTAATDLLCIALTRLGIAPERAVAICQDVPASVADRLALALCDVVVERAERLRRLATIENSLTEVERRLAVLEAKR
jgi:hypothetical protein